MEGDLPLKFMGIDISPKILLILAPAFLMVIAIPLILKKVPKNGFYGFRTPKTMAGSDEQWYRINREGGIAILQVPFHCWPPSSFRFLPAIRRKSYRSARRFWLHPCSSHVGSRQSSIGSDAASMLRQHQR